MDPSGQGSERRRLLHRHIDASVLIVDDSPMNVAVLERMLRSAGLERVTTLVDPREAVRSFLEIEPDLVLLDLHMPHMDGISVMESIRASLPDETFLPIVILTGDVTHDVRDRALAAGATDFLTKPFDHAEALLRVRNLLEARSLYTSLRQHNAVLQAHIAARREQERRRSAERQRLEERIDRILYADDIGMAFQPIIDLQHGEVLGFEALARFETEPRRPPNEWFDEAAVVGRGAALELAAVRTALAHLDRVPDGMFLSVNVSPATAMDEAFGLLLATSPMERVVVELTEHARVDDYPRLLLTIADLRARGARVAVDDAGAGYAGLRHVLLLRPDILKLDISLTSGIDDDPALRALGTAMVTLATEIGATIVAEGIETAGELRTLQGLLVPWGQGYHLAQPGPLPTPVLGVRDGGSGRTSEDLSSERPPN